MMEYKPPFKSTDQIAEFGGGQFPKYHPNYDIRPLPEVDHVINFNIYPLPIPDNNYNGIFCKYMIEHISWRNINNFLSEIYRILKPGGYIVLITANLLEQAKIFIKYDEQNQLCDDILGMIFGDEDYEENTHRCGFSPQSITRILSNIGFKDIELYSMLSCFGPTDLLVQATK